MQKQLFIVNFLKKWDSLNENFVLHAFENAEWNFQASMWEQIKKNDVASD